MGLASGELATDFRAYPHSIGEIVNDTYIIDYYNSRALYVSDGNYKR